MPIRFRSENRPSRPADVAGAVASSSIAKPGSRWRKASRVMRRALRLESLESRQMLTVVPLITSTAQAKVLVPSVTEFSDFGLDWTGGSEPFVDSAWLATPVGGPNGAGYNGGTVSTVYTPFIGQDLKTAMAAAPAAATAFMRIPFTATNVSALSGLTLKMRYDDGFIAWLNGVEIARVGVTGYPARDATIANNAANATSAYTTFDASPFVSAVHSGSNVLAIRGLNSFKGDSVLTANDFLMQAALDGFITDVPPTAVNDTATVTQDASTIVNVLANDVKGTGNIVASTVAVSQTPAHGVATANANGTITYTPTAGYAGPDSFTYIVRDDTVTGGAAPITFSAATSDLKYLIPTSTAVDVTWRDRTFVDTTWTTVSGPIGYDTTGAFTTAVGLPADTAPGGLLSEMQTAAQSSAYIRKHFSVSSPSSIQSLTLRMRTDDGFIAYINGVQVASFNAPATPAFNSVATAAAVNATAVTFVDYPITGAALTAALAAMVSGDNVLAIHGMNQATTSSDFLQQAELVGTAILNGIPSNAATVSVSVRSLGPTAVDDTARTAQGKEILIPVVANDLRGLPPTNEYPLDNNTLTVSQQPANGTVVLDKATGSIRYTPNPGFSGDDSFYYTIRDTNPNVGGTSNVTPLAVNATWKYLDDGSNQYPAFKDATFNDTAWKSGAGPFGYGAPGATFTTTMNCDPNPGDGCNEATNDNWANFYLRTTFNIDDPTKVQALNVLMQYDDGVVVYLNGTEIGRSAGVAAGQEDFQTHITAANSAALAQFVALTATQISTLLKPGANLIAVLVKQGGANSSDILMGMQINATVANPIGRVSNPGKVSVHVNQSPAVVADNVTIGPRQSPILNILANDSDPDNSQQASPGTGVGINPSTRRITTPLFNVASPATPLTSPTITPNPDGTVTFNGTNVTRPGTFRFGYRVSDYDGDESAEAFATITVNVILESPQPDAAAVATGESVTIDVLANDRGTDTSEDFDIRPSSVFVVSQPLHGTVTISPVNGAITYTSTPGFADQVDTFTYASVDEGNNPLPAATVTLDVFSRAVATADGFGIEGAGTEILIPFSAFWANDYIPPKFEPAVQVIAGSAVNGTVSPPVACGTEMCIRFTKTPGAFGEGSFLYKLVDSVGNPTRPDSNSALVKIALGSITISGKVYVDVNHNNIFEAGEQPVRDAVIVLTKPGDNSFAPVEVKTNANGEYSFSSSPAGVLAAGVYTITEVQPSLYLDFPTGAVNSYTQLLTAQQNPGFDFREWTVNPQFFSIMASYSGGFLASQQPVALSASSLVVPYDKGWNGSFNARAVFNPAAGAVTVKVYNASGVLLANSANNAASTPGNAVVSLAGSPSQPLVLVVSGTNPNVLVTAPDLGVMSGDTTVPYVLNTAIRSSQWSQSFVDHLASTYLGNGGYAVQAGETLPWGNLDTIQIRFTENVNVAAADLRLGGVAVNDYRSTVGVAAFNYDPLTFTATWRLNAPINADQLRLGLSSAVRDTFGHAIGNGGFEKLFNVLPGDMSHGLGLGDYRDVLARGFSSIGSSKYSPYYDLDGNGAINFVDAVLARNGMGALVPEGIPGGAASTPSPQAPAAVVVSARTSGSGPAAIAAAGSRTLVARPSRVAAVDEALTAVGTGGSSGELSANSLRARRVTRTVRAASVNDLGGF